jgi:hypothetical protein
LSNFESDINAVKVGKRMSTFRPLFAGGITTGDEGGGITVHDESATDPEMEFKNILNVLNKNKLSLFGEAPAIEESESDSKEGKKGPLKKELDVIMEE